MYANDLEPEFWIYILQKIYRKLSTYYRWKFSTWLFKERVNLNFDDSKLFLKCHLLSVNLLVLPNTYRTVQQISYCTTHIVLYNKYRTVQHISYCTTNIVLYNKYCEYKIYLSAVYIQIQKHEGWVSVTYGLLVRIHTEPKG